MEFSHLSSSLAIRTISEDRNIGVFEIDGLYAGYGLTIGNALRRTLLSSLPGAAATQIKVKNVSHEFSTLPGVKEDIVELCLNFKKLRFVAHSDEPQTVTLSVKGEKVVTGEDIKLNSDVELINPEEHLATLTTKSAELTVEIKVERGLGYSPVEARKSGEKLSVGSIAIDAFFSPVVRVHYAIENMRVGDRTDYNRIRLEVETDGTISPSSALHKSAVILQDHFTKIAGLEVKQFEEEVEKKESKKKKEK